MILFIAIIIISLFQDLVLNDFKLFYNKPENYLFVLKF